MLMSGLEGTRHDFLVVDPGGDIQTLIKVLLEPIASSILLTREIDDSLEKIRGGRPAAVIAACDIHAIGIRLCRRIRQEPPIAGTPFVVMTANSDVRSYPVYLEIGCDQILPIPFRCAEFYRAIKVALARNLEIGLEKVQVLFTSGLAGFVDRLELDRLIAAREIICFRRRGGVAIVDRDPVRRAEPGDYRGDERRRSAP